MILWFCGDPGKSSSSQKLCKPNQIYLLSFFRNHVVTYTKIYVQFVYIFAFWWPWRDIVAVDLKIISLDDIPEIGFNWVPAFFKPKYQSRVSSEISRKVQRFVKYPYNQLTSTRRQGDVVLGRADVGTTSVLGRHDVKCNHFWPCSDVNAKSANLHSDFCATYQICFRPIKTYFWLCSDVNATSDDLHSNLKSLLPTYCDFLLTYYNFLSTYCNLLSTYCNFLLTYYTTSCRPTTTSGDFHSDLSVALLALSFDFDRPAMTFHVYSQQTKGNFYNFYRPVTTIIVGF